MSTEGAWDILSVDCYNNKQAPHLQLWDTPVTTGSQDPAQTFAQLVRALQWDCALWVLKSPCTSA